jgi:hypothetical protein
MIEIGKTYNLITLEHTDGAYGYVTQYNVKVTGREENLVQINGHEVINTASPLFHSLTDVEAKKKSIAESEAKFLAEITDEDKRL